jgi:hypothetical protein
MRIEIFKDKKKPVSQNMMVFYLRERKKFQVLFGMVDEA